MMTTQEKVNRNLAGLSFLNSRPDTRTMLPQSKVLDDTVTKPAFHCCRYIMRDNMTVIQISLRVLVTTYADSGEQYTHRDISGRGTTFEMALFDLSAQLIKAIDENDYIDTEELSIIQEGKHNERTQDTNESVRTDEPGTPVTSDSPTEQDAGKGMAARSDNSNRHGKNAKRDSRRKRTTADGRGRSRGTQRSSG